MKNKKRCKKCGGFLKNNDRKWCRRCAPKVHLEQILASNKRRMKRLSLKDNEAIEMAWL